MIEVQTKERAASLHELPFYPEDEKRLEAIEKKKQLHSFELAFCGHFSAGKSSLLNRFLGKELLPTSPIPTSANIISIENGPVSLQVTNINGEVETWHDEIPWDQAKKWGMDGEKIKSIDISAPLPFLADHCKVLDTPGVDSTDERHQEITAGQLLTTDMIVYVSDYNHVQSETNIQFLKQLANEKKPIILVINQIDKHDDKELSLQSFENTVRSMLVKFNIKPVEIFFTSMKQEDHPFNQFSKLDAYLKAVAYNSDLLMEESGKRLQEGAVLHLMESLEEEKQDAFEEWKEQVEEKGLHPEDALRGEERREQLNNIDKEYQEEVQSLYKERNQLFKNVNLFPYSTTEKARAWLFSQQKKFKVGLFFSKAKTQEEKRNRTKALLEELNEKIKTQLLFHVRKMLLDVDEEFLDQKEVYKKKVNGITFSADEELLSAFASDSEIDRNYVYTFTGNVTNEIVKHVKAQTENLFKEYEEAVARYYNQRRRELAEKEAQSADLSREWEEWEVTREGFDQSLSHCKEWLDKEASSSFLEQLKKASQSDYPKTNPDIDIQVTQEEESVIATETAVEPIPENNITMDESFLPYLEDYLTHFQDRAVFSEEKAELREMLSQYKNNTAVISLFGAFSAGKSSFINAMLGETVLPVSPHPTTAAVNRIRKSSERYPNGSVVLLTKDESFLNQEIQSAARELGDQMDINTILKWKKPDHSLLNGYQRTYADYLYTLQQSLRKRIAELDKSIEITLDELKDWVAKEEKACMIKEVIVHYDCEWTRKGLELIDTPGVNSIHGRHTNVAFEHLRQSDAIFYLTYYNHAFSKADQVFLQQIGRANENFEKDKLFFIINAADLASTPYELNGVKNHVRDQIVKNGIQKPRLFALSSKEGLKVKHEETDKKSSTGKYFLDFEKYFSRTTWDELKAFHLNKIKRSWEDIYKQMESMLSSLEDNPDLLQKHLEEKQKAATTFQQSTTKFDVGFLTSTLKEEIQQQSSYLKERAHFIIHDYFSHAINPASLTGTTKKQQRIQLKGALQELEGFARQYISQEQETIVIRLEEHIKKELEQYTREFLDRERSEYLHIPSPSLKVSLQGRWQIQRDFSLDKDPLMDFYKSNKDFFENRRVLEQKEAAGENAQQEIHHMMHEFEAELKEKVESYIKELTERGQDILQKAAEREIERATWMYDSSKMSELKEERKVIEKGLTS